MNKIVNNQICRIGGCNKPADTNTAKFCKECANVLVAKGLGIGKVSKID